jgi:hypothetical protein
MFNASLEIPLNWKNCDPVNKFIRPLQSFLKEHDAGTLEGYDPEPHRCCVQLKLKTVGACMAIILFIGGEGAPPGTAIYRHGWFGGKRKVAQLFV